MERGDHWFYRLTRATARWFCLLFFRNRGIHQERVPREGGFLLAVNHSSNLDSVLASVSIDRPVYFLARRTLFDLPIFGWVIRHLNALPLEREGVGLSAFRAAEACLENGGGVLLFPEGTRSRDGKIGRMRPGVVRLAQRTGALVVPAFIVGSYDALPRGAWFPRPVKTEVRFGAAFAVSEEEKADVSLERLRKAWLVLAEGDVEETRPQPKEPGESVQEPLPGADSGDGRRIPE